MNGLAAILPGLGLTLGAFGAAIYFLVLFRRPSLVRLLNGSGLLFTAIGLVQASMVLQRAAALGPVHDTAAWAVAILALAVLAQAIAALRNRRAWDGSERRAGGGVG